MKKTVGTLCVGEFLFEPRIDRIIQHKIDRIEKTDKGTRVDLGSYSLRLDYCNYSADISTKVNFAGDKNTYYVRHEDALKKQKELQIAWLKKLQSEAIKALNELNEFTNKYFTNETIH
ncbi:hypothetical protein [Mangrovibacterium sp.]|uniref:hypothetical protein n=1 Tax=Mangrovibacterium sp. TaxID=1961364 RepID=UPI0035679E42